MKWLLIIAVLLNHVCCKAQTWDEWFRQRKTQIKYLEEQIIALHVYDNYLQDGYNIVHGRLSAIRDIKHGDFDLHKNYFSSLVNVNPSLANYNKTAGTINLQLKILQLNTAINKVLNSKLIQNNERLYVKAVMKSILQKCLDNISDLTTLTSKGQLEMKDDERIKRIHAIYEEVKDKYLFASHLKEQVEILSVSRQKECSSIQTLQSLYNLK